MGTRYLYSNSITGHVTEGMTCTFFNVGCDLKQELHLVKSKVYTEFITKKECHLYDNDKFREFCIFAGATKLFDCILNAVTTSRHSSDRIDKQKKSCFAHI